MAMTQELIDGKLLTGVFDPASPHAEAEIAAFDARVGRLRAELGLGALALVTHEEAGRLVAEVFPVADPQAATELLPFARALHQASGGLAALTDARRRQLCAAQRNAQAVPGGDLTRGLSARRTTGGVGLRGGRR